jgi:hypothetical protein
MENNGRKRIRVVVLSARCAANETAISTTILPAPAQTNAAESILVKDYSAK